MKRLDIPCTFNFTNIDPIAVIEYIADGGDVLIGDNHIMFFCDSRPCIAEYKSTWNYMNVKADMKQWRKIGHCLIEMSDPDRGILLTHEGERICAFFVEN